LEYKKGIIPVVVREDKEEGNRREDSRRTMRMGWTEEENRWARGGREERTKRTKRIGRTEGGQGEDRGREWQRGGVTQKVLNIGDSGSVLSVPQSSMCLSRENVSKDVP
jgi:hypothetical protein